MVHIFPALISMGTALAAMLACMAAGGQAREPTPISGIGVWYQPGAPASESLWRAGDPGQRLLLRARVLGSDGSPVMGALVELWHADANGVVHPDRYRSALFTDPGGRIKVSTVYPGYIWGPRHIHVVVTHPDHQRLVTRLFFKRDPALADSDRPDLAVLLEDGRHDEKPALFGDIELVLRSQ